MKWWLRFLGWGAVLAYASTFIAAGYQHLLLAIVSTVLGFVVRPPGSEQVDLAASNVLGIYCAMCLASVRAPGRTRLRAVLIGCAALVVVELGTGLLAITVALSQSSHAWSPTAQQAFETLTGTPRIFSVPALWIWLLGRWELPDTLRLGTRSPLDMPAHEQRAGRG